jgi:photosystem II stability/assembly factor-like uncharacterized protein
MKQLLLLFVFLVQCLPQTAAQWRKHTTLPGGPVFDLDRDGDFVYVTMRGGIYRSNDEGYHWEQFSGIPAGDNPVENALEFQVQDEILYCLGEEAVLYKSDDAGHSWDSILSATIYGRLTHFTVDEQRIIAVANNDMVYISEDRGASWGEVEGVSGNKIFKIGYEYFISDDKAVYRSSNNGTSWEKVFSTVSLSGVFTFENRIYLFYKPLYRIVFSGDGLRSWSIIEPEGLNAFMASDNILVKELAGIGSQLLIVYRFIFASDVCDDHLATSDNNGKNWTSPTPNAPFPYNFHSLQTYPDHVLAAHDFGVSHIDLKAENWARVETAFTGQQVEDILFQEHNPVIKTTQQIFPSVDGGDTWENRELAFTLPCDHYFQMEVTQQRLFFNLGLVDTLYVSEDKGENYMPLALPMAFYYIALCSTANSLWLSNGDTLLALRDGEWTFRGYPMVDKQPGMRLATLTEDVFLVFNFLDYPITTYNGQGEVMQNYPTLPCLPVDPNSPISQFYKFLFQNGDLYFFCDTNVYVCRQGKYNWENIYPQDWTTGIPFSVDGIEDIVVENGIFWALVKNKGLFFSTDGGNHFFPVQPPVTDARIEKIAVHENTLWVATYGGNIYSLQIKPTLPKAGESLQFTISPNPSNGQLIVNADQFVLAEGEIALYSASGSLLFQDDLAPGQRWEYLLNELPNAVYFLRLTTSGHNATLKWVLQR